jgi:hypothetical protein
MRITRAITFLLVGLAVIILPACQRSSSEDDAAATLNPLYTQQALTVAAFSTLCQHTENSHSYRHLHAHPIAADPAYPRIIHTRSRWFDRILRCGPVCG